MTNDKLKILSISEDFNTPDELRSYYKNIGEQHCIIQTNLKNFNNTEIDYDILLFSLNDMSTNSINSLFDKVSLKNNTPVILVCSEQTTEDELEQISANNKLTFKKVISSEELEHDIASIHEKISLEKRIQEYETKIATMDSEIRELKKELGEQQQTLEELEQLKKENSLHKLNIDELSATNEHLIAATWRERDLKKQLREAMEAINESKNIIEEQNKRIEQSINYATKIQKAINIKETDLKSILPNSSVYFKPKDVISGDFPWMFEKEDFVYIAAVDCTGHGVPGAMMSMIGNLLLNDIAHEEGEHTPGQLLDRLHTRVIKTLKQDNADSNANDGMDVAMIRFNKRTNEVIFASAHRPLVHITQEGDTKIIKGDKFPIGGLHYEKVRVPFTDHTLSIDKGDMLFLFTDGLTDQVGGNDSKKIGTNTIFQILSSLRKVESNKISEFINLEFENWKGSHKQIDDVLLMALRF